MHCIVFYSRTPLVFSILGDDAEARQAPALLQHLLGVRRVLLARRRQHRLLGTISVRPQNTCRNLLYQIELRKCWLWALWLLVYERHKLREWMRLEHKSPVQVRAARRAPAPCLRIVARRHAGPYASACHGDAWDMLDRRPGGLEQARQRGVRRSAAARLHGTLRRGAACHVRRVREHVQAPRRL